MKENNNVDKRKKIITFSIIILFTAGITSILTAAFFKKDKTSNDVKSEETYTAGASPVNYEGLINNNNILSSRINSLQQLDQKYADHLSTSGEKIKLDSINLQIFIAEEILRGSIDSIFLNGSGQGDSSLNYLSNNMVTTYRSILNNRQAVSSLRTALNFKSLSTDDRVLLKLQDELQQKNKQLITLENSLKNMSIEKNPSTVKNDVKEDNTNGSGKKIVDLENKVYMLTSTNYILKQDNENFLKGQTDVLKNNNNNDLSFKNKTAALQQKVDVLNAELRLARVDCNLTRVDAAQIISNSRQRKELLSEASGILTSLSKYEDADIKKKVHDKITKLNQVAANSRD